jgi:hypothetical protein
MSLFTEGALIDALDSAMDKHLRDCVTVYCKDGSKHEIVGTFRETEFIAEMDLARTKVDEKSFRVACVRLNGIDLDGCHWLIDTRKAGKRWMREITTLRVSTTHYEIRLEECDAPTFGRKQAVDKFCKPARKFRNRRHSNLQQELIRESQPSE